VHKEVTLSDGQPVQVRVLGLFELDTVGPEIPGPYRYQVLTWTGRVYEIEYTPPDEPPEKPDAEEPEPRSLEWHQLQDYETYQAWLAHEADRVRAIEQWLENCAHYVLERCLEQEDRERIIEPEDYHAVHEAALVPRLRKEDIAQALAQTFRADFDGTPVLDALWRTEPGHARLDTVKLWEAELLNHLGIFKQEDLDEYAQLPVMERAVKVAAFKLFDWLAALEMDEARREAK
jgi:hypothetical protein